MKKVNRRDFFVNSLLAAGVGLTGLGFKNQGSSSTEKSGNNNSGNEVSQKLLENARIILETSCRAKSGETLLILEDDVIHPYMKAFSTAAIGLGLVPAVFDIRDYLTTSAYLKGFVLPSLKSALESSDIVIENLADTWVPNRPDYGRLTGKPEMQDAALTSERRWMILQSNGMEEWNLAPEKIANVRKRTLWLMNLLKTARTGRIISKKGTDFTFGLGKGSSHTPILGIIPYYGEVAIVPDLSSTSGTFIVDGPTQREVRTIKELDKEPFRVDIASGKIKNIKGGDPIQRKRLEDFIASGDPAADSIDEVGIVTTSFVENDKYYWSDGTHHHDTVHIALGNNSMRNKLVHGPKHMDCEVLKPTISIDGLVIIKDGIFQEKVLGPHA